VRTHIASGNVSFDGPARTNRRTLAQRLAALVSEAGGFDVPVFVRSCDEVAALLALDSFENERVSPDVSPCIIFISDPLPSGVTLPYRSPKGEFHLLHATPGEVFALMSVRDGRPGNPSAFIEKTYGVKATTRFVSAVEKIVAAASGRPSATAPRR
jgi:uncharacterized protein (DUF1697 family)